MAGAAIVVLFGLMLWLFSAGWLPLTVIPAIGICLIIKHDKNGASTDQVFVAGFVAVAVLFAYALLKGVFGSF